MDGYIQDVRTRFGHPDPIKPQHSPHKHREIVYGAKAQLITDEIDDSPSLDAAGIKNVQGIVGSLLYYARAVDNKLLCTVSAIGMKQASATQHRIKCFNLSHLWPSTAEKWRRYGPLLHHVAGVSWLTSNLGVEKKRCCREGTSVDRLE